MTSYYFFRDLEQLMRQALTAALLGGAVIFTSSIVLGMEYAIFLAFVVLFAIALVQWARGRNG